MLNVFVTVDVEVWCDGWDSIDAKFPEAFKRYVYGPTSRGNYALPYILRVLEEYALAGVFFVEPLFAGRFGLDPLTEIVGLIRDSDQEIQLHLHTEWVDEAREPLFPRIDRKRQHMRYFSRDEQKVLIGAGFASLKEAGAPVINAFRAGSFGFNVDTLAALNDNGIPFDSSYNATLMGVDSGLLPGTVVCEPLFYRGVYEYPMTVYQDRPRHLRHAQIGACSFRELEGLLWAALEEERKAFVILFHNFELLNRAKDRPDDVVVERYRKLCRFLARNRDCFQTCRFHDLQPTSTDVQPTPLRSALWKTGLRTLEQIYRRRYS
jgi:hypothetical protein